jgi:hypothetical protein
METDPQTIDRYLPVIAWLIVGFGGLWLVTSVVGYFQRKAYHLTHAESGSSKNITPDFLKVDHAKREAAIARGATFDKELDRRERAAAPVPPVATVGRWSRIFATGAVLVGLVVTVVGTLQRVQTLQREFSSWDEFIEIVQQNQVGAIVAVVIIAANGYVAYTKLQSGKA